ncbi:Copia protein, partial [Mucuna pruriens]
MSKAFKAEESYVESSDEDEEANLCLMADTPFDDEDDEETCLTIGRKPLSWFLHCGNSPHMTGEDFMFQDLCPKKGGWVTIIGTQKGKIVGVVRIGKHPFLSIDNLLFVKGLKHNLISISQLCDSGYDVSFNKGECIVKDCKGSIIFSVKRQNNLYNIDLIDLTNQNITCLVSINDNHWTRHKKLGHASLRLIFKLKKHNLMKGLPSLVYKVDLLRDACEKGKQIKGSFESKNIVSTSRPMELLHIDLFGPT